MCSLGKPPLLKREGGLTKKSGLTRKKCCVPLEAPSAFHFCLDVKVDMMPWKSDPIIQNHAHLFGIWVVSFQGAATWEVRQEPRGESDSHFGMSMRRVAVTRMGPKSDRAVPVTTDWIEIDFGLLPSIWLLRPRPKWVESYHSVCENACKLRSSPKYNLPMFLSIPLYNCSYRGNFWINMQEKTNTTLWNIVFKIAIHGCF